MAAQLIPNDGGNLRILTMATTWTTKRCAAIKVTNSSHGACPFLQVGHVRQRGLAVSTDGPAPEQGNVSVAGICG